MPVQFLATVWCPESENFSQRNILLNGPGIPYQYKPLFSENDDDQENDYHRDHLFTVRQRRSLPDYCTKVPILESPSPSAASIISVPISGVTINLKASTPNGSITRFSFNSPIGMKCTPVDNNGEVSCTFVPTSSQLGKLHNFCFIADDSAGLQDTDLD